MRLKRNKQQNEEANNKSSGGGSKLIIVILIMLFVLCLAGGALAALIMFMPSFTVDSYFKYVERGEPDEYALVYGPLAVSDDYYALIFDGAALLDTGFLTDYGIDPHIFWDSNEHILTVSTPLRIIQMKPDEPFYTVNGEKTAFAEGDALYEDGESGKVFMPISFAADFYQLEYAVTEMGTVIVDSRMSERSRASVKSNNTAVRHKPDSKSDIAEKVRKGSFVYIFSENAQDGFLRVRTENGAFGWVKESALRGFETIAAVKPETDTAPLPSAYENEKISLIWDQVGGEGGIEWVSEKIGAVNVVSPTWLHLSDGEGGITDYGSKNYAEAARAAGYRLWPLFSNSFDAEITHAALSSTAKRRGIIEQVIEALHKYGAEGINVDFEAYKIEDGYYYTQFLRELCVALRLEGFISSVALPPPTLQNSPTDRSQIGKYADYVTVMAYDQHWASSPVKGPVAGYDWVLNGIMATISYMPPEKVVLGLPLYTRIWYEPKGTDELSSRDFAMQHVSELFKLREAKMTWEDDTKYYRGEYEYEIDGVLNEITAWLETTETLRAKAEIINEQGLAGAACWKKGLEPEGFWQILAECLREQN